MSKSKNEYYEWAVGTIRLNLSVLGLWTDPDNPTNRLLSCMPIFGINIYLLFGAMIPQTWALYRVRHRLDCVISTILTLYTFWTASFKMFFLLKKKASKMRNSINKYLWRVICNFFVTIKEDWDSDMSESEINIMIKYWRISHKIHFYAFLLGFLLPVLYHSTLFFGFVLRPLSNLTDIIDGRHFVFSSVLPFDRQSSPIYEVIAVNEFLLGCVTCTVITVCDVLYSILMFHAAAQLEIFNGRIEKFTCNKNNYRDLLEYYVNSHLRIIKFAKNIDDLFNEMILIVFAHFILTFCLQGFLAITPTASTDLGKFKGMLKNLCFMCYSIYMLFLNFVYCWAGEILITKSEAIHSAIYECNWMDFPPKISILLNLMRIRSKKPLAVTAGKFLPVTLNTYAKLVKTCAGYISMLVALNG